MITAQRGVSPMLQLSDSSSIRSPEVTYIPTIKVLGDHGNLSASMDVPSFGPKRILLFPWFKNGNPVVQFSRDGKGGCAESVEGGHTLGRRTGLERGGEKSKEPRLTREVDGWEGEFGEPLGGEELAVEVLTLVIAATNKASK
ncbi:hypothetical protein FRC08_018727 [Ceratobasidium sp. 394]|nr:hypothetical protein FRC08_018727 [Ceratobasidium sp. 394]KAG9093622.1 hypothetical protein FS749_014082 [Ceratobasidium sp. UAMH 11750]